jgi:hypothetical protein
MSAEVCCWFIWICSCSFQDVTFLHPSNCLMVLCLSQNRILSGHPAQTRNIKNLLLDQCWHKFSSAFINMQAYYFLLNFFKSSLII